MMRVAINGFGRIGRNVLKVCLERGVNVVAINDVHGTEDARYLLQHDSVYGTYEKQVSASGNVLQVGRKSISVVCERDIKKLPWKKLKVDVVVEATGIFIDPRDAQNHLKCGAKRVVITAPCKGSEPDATVVVGVNDSVLSKDSKIISVASCTTNCLVPVVKVLHDTFGIKRALMTTVHAYTNDQAVHDQANKKKRRGRAAALNMIPTTTGAAKSVVKVMPELLGKINGLAVRVPIDVGSLVDLVAELEDNYTVKEVNASFKHAALGKLKGIMEYSEDELVSSDVKKNTHSCVVDSLSTQTDGNLVKVLAWYDNEWGYSHRVVDVLKKISRL